MSKRWGIHSTVFGWRQFRDGTPMLFDEQRQAEAHAALLPGWTAKQFDAN